MPHQNMDLLTDQGVAELGWRFEAQLFRLWHRLLRGQRRQFAVAKTAAAGGVHNLVIMRLALPPPARPT